MQISAIPNYSAYKGIQSKPSFKSFDISDDYCGRFYKYADSDEREKFDNACSRILGESTDLHIRPTYENKTGWPHYLKPVIEDKDKWHIADKEKEFYENFNQIFDKYSNCNPQKAQELKEKYNKMVDSMGKEGKSLSVDIYPPAACFNGGKVVYVVPALDIAGVTDRTDHFYYRDGSDFGDWKRHVVLPSKDGIKMIKGEIFNKLHSIFEEGLANGEEEITIPAPTGEIKPEILDILKKEEKNYDSYQKRSKEYIGWRPVERDEVSEEERRRISREIDAQFKYYEARDRERETENWDRPTACPNYNPLYV